MNGKYLALLLLLTLIPALLAGCKEELPESKLNATVNVLPDSRVQVDGTTNLPDGANILVTLRQPGSRQPIVQALPIVKNQSFSTTLGPLNTVGVITGSYEIYVMFSPESFAWSDQVLPAVGQKGEKLAGPQVRQKDNGVRVLENSISFNYVAASAAPPSPEVISPYGVSDGYGYAAAYGYGAPPPTVP